MRLRSINVHVGELANQVWIVAAEFDDTVILGPALQLARVFFRIIGDQNALGRANHLSADLETLLVQAMLQGIQAFFFQRFRRLVGQVCRRSAQALAVNERVGEVETDVFDQLHGLFEVFLGLAREANDEVRADANPRHGGPQLAQFGFVFQRGVVALHCREDPVRARLHRQVQVFDQLRYVGVGLDQAVGEFQRVRGGIANPVDAIDGGHYADQLGEIRQATVVSGAAIAVDVLPQQGHFTHAVFGQVNDLGDDVVERAADFFTAGVRHHAERAVLAAAFHDRHISARAINARLGQVVEFFDFRERDVHLRQLGGAGGVDHFRQAVQGLRAEYHVNIRRAITDRSAFLAGHAAADGDYHVRVGQFQFAPATQLGVHPVLGAFADRAGVEQDDVGVFSARGDFQGLMFTQQIDHARAVVLVHLATVGFDVKLLGHGKSHHVIQRTAHYREHVPRFLPLCVRWLCYSSRPHFYPPMCCPPTMTKREAPIYKVIFLNQGQVYEMYAKQIYQSDLWGFLEVEEFVFGERTQVVVDPSEEKLKAQFEGVVRSFVPMHSIVRIDEVERLGTPKISEARGAVGNVMPFPMPMPEK